MEERKIRLYGWAISGGAHLLFAVLIGLEVGWFKTETSLDPVFYLFCVPGLFVGIPIAVIFGVAGPHGEAIFWGILFGLPVNVVAYRYLTSGIVKLMLRLRGIPIIAEEHPRREMLTTTVEEDRQFKRIWWRSRAVKSTEDFTVNLLGIRQGIEYREGDLVYRLKVERGTRSDWIIYTHSLRQLSNIQRSEVIRESKAELINQRVSAALHFMKVNFAMDDNSLFPD